MDFKTSINEFVVAVKRSGFNVVSFDFDQTLTKHHSWTHKLGQRNSGYTQSNEAKDIKEKDALEIIGGSQQVLFIQQLFAELQRRNVKVVITSNQWKTSIEYILKAAKCTFNGITILGRAEVLDVSVSKAKALNLQFPNRQIIHLDDTKDGAKSAGNVTGLHLDDKYHPCVNSDNTKFTKITDSIKALRKPIQTTIGNKSEKLNITYTVPNTDVKITKEIARVVDYNPNNSVNINERVKNILRQTIAALDANGITDNHVLMFVKVMQDQMANEYKFAGCEGYEEDKKAGFTTWKDDIKQRLGSTNDKNLYLKNIPDDNDTIMSKFAIISAEMQRQSAKVLDTRTGRTYKDKELGARSYRVIQLLNNKPATKESLGI